MRHVAKRVVLLLLRAYKWAVSPMLPAACRYVPTCSEYAMEAVERYGAIRGSFMAIGRLLRCHPFVKGGYDPVVKQEVPWKSDALAPRQAPTIVPGFSPCGHQNLKRNL